MQRKQHSRVFRRGALATFLLAGAAIAVLPLGIRQAQAWEDENNLTLVKKIPIDKKTMAAFDISFVDPAISLYVLADRTNASVDFFDSREKEYIKSVGGFKGVVLNPDGTANNALSGPDGVVIVNHKEVWAGDGDSTLKVIDIASGKIINTITVTDPTDSSVKMRVDEMAWDSRDQILAAANNANKPPFVTLISTADTSSHKKYDILGQIVFNGSNNTPDATETGIEQPQWSPKTGLFYVSVPQTKPDDDTSGGVSVIDPSSMKVTATYEVDNCTPAGLALGPRHEALVGCSGTFGTSPPTTQTAIINIDSGKTVATITEAGGSDEVWYDPGTNHYYLAARNTRTNGVVTPILASVDAETNTFDGSAPTSTTAHSVAADKYFHHIFVPIGSVADPSTDPTSPCPTTGCIAVFEPSDIDHHVRDEASQ